MTPRRDDRALWRTLREQRVMDDLDEIAAMSPEELDADIRANGGDPDKIAAAGVALVKKLTEDRARLAWHRASEARLERFREEAAASATREKLPRATLLARLEAVRNDPRFSTQVGAAFQNKTFEESTDQELQTLVDQIELLAKLEDA